MKESKLIGLLEVLKKDELFRLRDFVSSPYHNKNQHVEALCKWLLKHCPDLPSAKVTKERAYATLFPGKAYDDLKIRHIASMLLKVVEDFIAVEKLFDRVDRRNTLVLEGYREKKLSKHFDGLKRQMAINNSQIPDDIEHYYYSYIATREEELMDEQLQERRTNTHLQNVSDRLDEFYLISKLKQCCAMVSYQNVFRQEYRMDFATEILAHLAMRRYDVPLLNGYHFGLLTLMQPQEENHFIGLKDLLVKHVEALPKNETQDLHVIARNYCIKRLNTGDTKYVRELFDLFRFELKQGVLLDENGYLSPSTFKNITAVGSRLGEFAWTEKFVTEYASHLDEKYQSDYLNYNLARVYFDKKDYQRSIKLLSRVEYHDVFVAADARTLLLKAYYELEEADALDALLESFKQFASRKKELAYHKENYLNTVKFTKYLLKLAPGNKAKKEKLRDKITKTKVLTEKAWLLQKLEEL